MKTTDQLKLQTHFSFEDLLDIMAILRSENGCPWDREQTHESIRENLLEEAYEAAEAIDLKDPDLLAEELGDVLLQVVFHCQIAGEEDRFDIGKVLDGICEKLIVRHPHIFSDVKADTASEVLSNWDAIKQQTKKRKNVGEELDGICRALPSLIRAEKIASKLRKRDLSEPVSIGETKLSDLTADTLGDALYYLTAKASEWGVSAEECLERKSESIVKKHTETLH